MPSYASGVSTRRDVALDVILAGSLAAWGQAEVWNSDASLLVGPKWANAVGYAVMSVLLLARRRVPVLVLTGQSVVLVALVMARPHRYCCAMAPCGAVALSDRWTR
jgi:hypothetical protein